MESLLRPWLLARFLSGLTAAALCVVAVLVAIRVLKHWRVGSTSEGQLVLERRAELVATLVQAGLLLALLGLVLLVLAADRSADSIRGAMCAYGVFDATPVGMWPLATGSLAALACAGWLALHRLDLRVAQPVLTRRKFTALFVVAPLVWLDLGTFVAFSSGLDFDVVASCCSVGLDGGAIGQWGAEASAGVRGLTFFVAALGLAVAAAVSFVWVWRRPGRFAAMVGAVLSLLAAMAMVPAVLYFIAPHAYETPRHLCPFCLLHADVGGIGWPLFASVFAGTALGVGMGVVAWQRGAGVTAPAREVLRGLGRVGALLWVSGALLAAFPVVRYWWMTGTGLFG